ncbi:exodeoxyribonuclease V subunit beta [Agaribacter flavus]|uniref:RecBCD enzyme subunit RecB n=1 Tax=Agaribacter flavus TaxID=1902781 RepID=A0ABV7FLW1_9ALTE
MDETNTHALRDKTRRQSTSKAAQEAALNLSPDTIPLHGIHLIEASAGTGKTFNITRIYLRLLLERELSVQQILVMTFTEAATEEIKGRVADYIDEVLAQWHSPTDPMLQAMQTRVSKIRGEQLLNIARLEIDDASIFTIHGFCQRLLAQFASSFQYNTEALIQTTTEAFYTQAITDALLLWRQDTPFFEQLEEAKLHTPAGLYTRFYAVFNKHTHLRVVNLEDIASGLMKTLVQAWQDAEDTRETLSQFFRENRTDFYLGLADKPANKEKIDKEVDEALAWLALPSPCSSFEMVFDNDDSQSEFFATLCQALESEKEANVDKLFVAKGFLILTSAGRKKKYTPEFADKLTMQSEAVQRIFSQAYTVNGKKIFKGLGKLGLYQLLAPKLLAIKEKVNVELDRQGLLSFDQMISKVAEGLCKQDNRENLLRKIRNTYPVALVDEFQDTDDNQYAILDALYGRKKYQTDSAFSSASSQLGATEGTDGNNLTLAAKDLALYMIGDPKQAIYGFRGGDVFTYLSAKHDADYLWSMDTNWRSTQGMVKAYNALFSNSLNGDTPPAIHNTKAEIQSSNNDSKFSFGIDYVPVKASPSAKAASVALYNAQTEQAQTTALHFAIADVPETAKNKDQEYQQIQLIIQWMIKEIIDLLEHYVFRPVSNDEPSQHSQVSTNEPVRARDIAILVRTGHEANLIRSAFAKAGLKSVYLSERTALFESIQAKHLFYVLDAINTLNDMTKTRAALATGVLLPNDAGIKVQALFEDEDHPNWQVVYKLMAEYKQRWWQEGVFSLVNGIVRTNVVPILDAERVMTNFMHLAEELASVAVIQHTPKAQLLWLQKQISGKDANTSEIRLESDQALIKIITQHKSKGLEYPIVFVPFANAGAPSLNLETLVYHNKEGRLTTQLGFSNDAYTRAFKEEQAERMRLLYVAVTRSTHRCYLGMLCAQASMDSALHKALGLNNSGDTQRDIELKASPWDMLAKAIRCELKAVMDVVCIHQVLEQNSSQYMPERQLPDLTFKKVSVAPPETWALRSFSAIAQAHSDTSGVQSLSRDLEDPAVIKQASTNYTPQSPMLRFSLTPGADAGNLLHDLLELTDFSSPDFAHSWQSLAHKYSWFDETQKDALFEWLQACLQTPIMENGLCLKDLAFEQTLRESNFFFPLDGLSVTKLNAIITEHRKTLSEYWQLPYMPLNLAGNIPLHGLMQGFIDLIFEHEGRYYLVDYKSSFLGDRFSDYDNAQLFSHMQSHYYDLQYHIYAVALHRLLKQKIQDYSYNKHFGGVMYLYLRGMTNEQINCAKNGVYYVPPEQIDIMELDDLLGKA